MARITIPYAVADFAEMRERGFYYVDKTNYIPGLEDYKAPVFLRPRRFGKSLLISMLAHYYDRTKANRFEELFGGTWIGEHPTKEHNQYMVIRYDFSAMVMANDMEGLAQNFNKLNCIPVEVTLEHNRDLFGDFQFTTRGNAAQMLEELLGYASSRGLPKVYILNEAQPNAFATGRNPSHAAVAVTRGLMDIVDEDELSGVIGHELGHVHNRDILIGTVAATMAGAITFLANMAKWAAIFGGRGRRNDDRDGGSPLAMIAVAIFAPIAAMLVQMAISRTREYKADEFGAKVSGNPLYLARALRKLDDYSRRIPMRNAAPSTENMFIVSPLTGSKMASLFSTHPATEDRIRRLQEMAY